MINRRRAAVKSMGRTAVRRSAEGSDGGWSIFSQRSEGKGVACPRAGSMGGMTVKRNIRQYMPRQYMLANDYEIYHFKDDVVRDIDLHHHNYYEVYLLISGDLSYQIEGKSYRLLPGDIVLLGTQELHRPFLDGTAQPYERIVLWIKREYLDSLSDGVSDLSGCFHQTNKLDVIRPPMELQQTIRNTLLKLIDALDYKGFGADLLRRSYLTEVLVLLNNFCIARQVEFGIEVEKSTLIESVISYISDHLDSEISLDGLSDQFYLSKYHLLREFKKHTGTTIHRYILQKRLILCRERMLMGIPLNAVCHQCGFGDYSNFFRAFKNEYGITPMQFIRENALTGREDAAAPEPLPSQPGAEPAGDENAP